MARAESRARELRNLYGVAETPTDADLSEMCCDLGLTVKVSDSLGTAREVFTQGLLVLSSVNSPDWRRWLLAHALGHRLLHAGDQTQGAHVVRAKQECHADRFAFALLAAPESGDEPVHDWEVAERADIPLECVLALRHSGGGGGFPMPGSVAHAGKCKRVAANRDRLII